MKNAIALALFALAACSGPEKVEQKPQAQATEQTEQNYDAAVVGVIAQM